MKQKQGTQEKICTFYTGDYHFEMISLPYIHQKIEEEKEIVILTEKNLETSMKDFLERTNLKETKKEKILNLNWSNKTEEKIEKIRNQVKDQKPLTIFIKGKEPYIRKTNQEIIKQIPKDNEIKIIDCYEMEEVGEKMDEIMEQYDKILKTAGEKEIEKI